MTYTPTTDEVEEAWASRYDGESTSATGKERAGYYDEFRRWLEAHDREVKAQALLEAAELAEGQDGFEIEIGLANYIGSELRHRAQQLKEQA